MTNLVIVESPAKAKTINKYLGKDFQVLASFGHIRDLPSKDGSVLPDEDFRMIYEVDSDSKKHVKAIADAAKGAEALYLATDPDREGEAISWHVLEALKSRRAITKNTPVHRIVFNEITKRAVQEGIAHPREIDMDLVNAQQARRALDYLVGFNLSPILWRKLPGSRSAGRVQSVALRLICEREAEIEVFVPREYWDVAVDFATAKNERFTARLTHLRGEKLDKFSLANEAAAMDAVKVLENASGFAVREVKPKQTRRNPYAPFTTSTLQQDASRNLGFGAKKTMMVAQKLYEGIDIGGETTGLITYMRTDGVSVAPEAIEGARRYIGSQFGETYLPDKARRYSTKAKNAQEAHEAIRPTEVSRTPQSLKSHLDKDQYRLYELIWKRMVASQMAAAVFDQVSVEIDSADKRAGLRATGSVLKFDGFLKLYHIGRDEDEEDEQSRRLPAMAAGDALKAEQIIPDQHFTEPPPRYSEASLVKKMEELGIGRPSTYASIISVLQDRGYVRLEKRRFFPEPRGRVVTAFLMQFFAKYVETGFTAQVEEELDDVSGGRHDWKALLQAFWGDFSSQVETTGKMPQPDILKGVQELLESALFPTPEEGKPDPHACSSCDGGELSLKTGKFGPFIGCSNYPDCRYTREIFVEEGAEGAGEDTLASNEPQELGACPETGEPVSLRKGPYGFYVQRGEEKKAKRTGLPKGQSPADVTLEDALKLLALPRTIGTHPDTGKEIVAGIGRYGPYLLHDKKYTSLPGDELFSVGINRAVALINEKNAPPRVLGTHPDDGEEIAVKRGRYGPYISHGKSNARIPKGTDPQGITLEEAIKLIEASKSQPKTGKKKKAPARKKKKSA